ncbi:MAG: gliding motility protein GldB [Tannerella sp.]|jgi:uncharacterized protein YjaZ|nr:gliding motility protein GldB [Tannerella sp.]
MKKDLLWLITGLLLLAPAGWQGCEMKPGNATAKSVRINRFDKDVYRLMETDSPEWQQQLAANYAPLLEVIGQSVFRTKDTQTPDFFDRMINYYSEPTLNRLYRDALKQFDNIETIENDLGKAFQYFRTQLPDMQLPAVYMHVSGLRQNIIAGDSLLSLSIDKYMGRDYPLYQDYFYTYQLRKMEPAYIVPDYLAAWLLSEYPFRGDERVLLDRLIYEGKIKYVLHRAYSRFSPESWMGYTPEEYLWCRRNEKMLWSILIERKHLYTPDVVTTSKYFSPQPSTFIADEAPGDIGVWIGWQIVAKYMDSTGATVENLINNNDAQAILRLSKYKP